MNININPFDLLKNADKIREQMGAFQDKLAEITVTGSAGGGMAEIDLNGKFEVTAVRIAPEAVEDRQMLQDLVMAAFTSGLEKIKAAINSEMGTVAGSMGIQGFGGPSGFPPGVS